MSETNALTIENLSVEYKLPGGKRVVAVDDVTFSVAKGQTLGLVGESGSGKSTIGRAVLGMAPRTGGTITFNGESEKDEKARRIPRDQLGKRQMVFQDPFGSLNPRWRIRRTLAEPLRAQGVPRKEVEQRVKEAIESVGLNSADHLDRFPHEFSGGQRQRISIARALISRPEILVADEAVSALDVSVQAQVLNAMKKLQTEHEVASIFISHDLSVIQFIADRVVVLYFGQVMEEGDATKVFESPRHPYTVALISALPSVLPDDGRTRVRVTGEPPSQHAHVTGCPFASRCPVVTDACRVARPPLTELPDGSRVACIRVAADGTVEYPLG